MNIWDYIDPRRLYNPASRAGRIEFAWGFIAYPAVAIVIAVALLSIALPQGVDESVISSLSLAFSAVWWVAGVLIILRRIRDLGHSGWGIFLLVFPMAGLLIMLYLFFRPGHEIARTAAA